MNLRYNIPAKPWDVRVDRTTMMGNPITMQGEETRDFVCDEYATWFEEQLNLVCNQNIITHFLKLVALHKLYGKLRLFCWCAPKRCHAETIKKFIEESE